MKISQTIPPKLQLLVNKLLSYSLTETGDFYDKMLVLWNDYTNLHDLASTVNHGVLTTLIANAALYAKRNTGSYTGNNAANRAIAHGLGAIPALVYIFNVTDKGSGPVEAFISAADAVVFGKTLSTGYIISTSTPSQLAVTAADTTNFYVGNAAYQVCTMNVNNKVYRWIAFA